MDRKGRARRAVKASKKAVGAKASEKKRTRPKLGMIFECQRGGPDAQVCEYVVRNERPDIDLAPSATLGNKREVVERCGEQAKLLLAAEGDACHHVIIVWDLYPRWSGGKPCLHDDREAIFDSLKRHGVPRKKVTLVCVHSMLESWLLADHKAVTRVVEANARDNDKVRNVKKFRLPEEEHEAKDVLDNIFREYDSTYRDYRHAIEIMKAVDIAVVEERCDSFKRFLDAVRGVAK